MTEQSTHVKTCLLIGGKSDGRRIAFDTRQKYVRVLPRMRFALCKDEPVNARALDLSETYVRALLCSPGRDYHVYMHESLAEGAAIEALIAGYRAEIDSEHA